MVIMWTLSSFLLLSLAASVVVGDCSEELSSRTQVEFDDCYVTGMEIVNDCERIDTVINECCDLWSRCHNDVGGLRDRLIVELLDRDHAGQYDNCSVVREFRSSGRTVTNHEEHCDTDQLTHTMSLFRNCSEPHFAPVFNLFHNRDEIEDTAMIHVQICQTLQTIELRCSDHLKKCYSAADLQQTKMNELAYFREYLGSLFNGRVNISSVENCDAMESEDYDYPYGYSDEYMSSTEVTSFASEEETGSNLTVVLSSVTEKILTDAVDNTSEAAESARQREEEDLQARSQTSRHESNVKRLLNETKEAVDSTESFASEEDVTFASVDYGDEYAMDSYNLDPNVKESNEVDMEMNLSDKKSEDLTQRDGRKPRNESSRGVVVAPYLITTLVIFIILFSSHFKR